MIGGVEERRASFETAAARLPQDENFLILSKIYPNREERPTGASR
jgi:hypothetical protein